MINNSVLITEISRSDYHVSSWNK